MSTNPSNDGGTRQIPWSPSRKRLLRCLKKTSSFKPSRQLRRSWWSKIHNEKNQSITRGKKKRVETILVHRDDPSSALLFSFFLAHNGVTSSSFRRYVLPAVLMEHRNNGFPDKGSYNATSSNTFVHSDAYLLKSRIVVCVDHFKIEKTRNARLRYIHT